MKLVIAIIHDEDAPNTIKKLTQNHYRVTKLASTGGFLSSGNTTLLVGVERERLDEVIEIIKDTSKSRTKLVPAPAPVMSSAGLFMTNPLEVQVGGATLFVIDVDRYEKI